MEQKACDTLFIAFLIVGTQTFNRKNLKDGGLFGSCIQKVQFI